LTSEGKHNSTPINSGGSGLEFLGNLLRELLGVFFDFTVHQKR
jgi:hypothetical protein